MNYALFLDQSFEGKQGYVIGLTIHKELKSAWLIYFIKRKWWLLLYLQKENAKFQAAKSLDHEIETV